MIKKEFDVEVAKNLYLSSFDKRIINRAKKAVINEIKNASKKRNGAIIFTDKDFINIYEKYCEENIRDNKYNEDLLESEPCYIGKYKKIIMDWLEELGFKISEYYYGNIGVKGPYIIWYTEEYFNKEYI